jgi:hypothetical protein
MPLHAGWGLSGVEDGAVDGVGGALQGLHRVLHPQRRGRLVQAQGQLAREQGGGHATGDFAGVVAAHAVGEHGQPAGGIDQDGVFVVVADATGIDPEAKVIGHVGTARAGARVIRGRQACSLKLTEPAGQDKDFVRSKCEWARDGPMGPARGGAGVSDRAQAAASSAPEAGRAR